MAKKIYIKNGVNLDSATSLSGYKIVGYNSDDELSNLSEKNDLGDIREIGGGGGSSSVAPGNGVTASGTINYVSKFADTNILANSIIYDDGTNVGIGTASPSAKLSVYGTPTNYANLGSAFSVIKESATSFIQFRYNNIGDIYITSEDIHLYNSTTGKDFVNYASGLSGLQYSYNVSDYLYKSDTSTGVNKFEINHSGLENRLGIGVSPTSTTHIRGIDNTSSNYALKVESASASSLLSVRNDGLVQVNTTLTSANLIQIQTKDATNDAIIIRDNTNTYDVVNINGNGYSTFRAINITAPSYPILNLTSNSTTWTISKYLTELYLSYQGSDNLTLYSTGAALLRGNLGVGNFTDSSTRLYVRGSDSSSGTYSLKIQNSSSADLLSVRNDGFVSINGSTFNGKLEVTGGSNQGVIAYSSNIAINGVASGAGAIGVVAQNQSGAGTSLFIRSYDASNVLINIVNSTTNNISRMLDSGYFGIGTITPTAMTHIKGIDNTSSNYALKVESASASSILSVRNDGRVFIGKSIIANAPMEVGFGQDPYSTGFNTALGVSSLSSWVGIYSAGANIAVGYETLKNLTTGQYNVAVGYQALTNVVTGGYNTSLNYSLISNLTGEYNVALGYGNLNVSTSSNTNIAIGRDNLFSFTSGTNNIAISGYAGLYNLVTGSNNIAIGYLSLAYVTSASSNTVIGNSSLNNNPFTGDNNTVIGDSNLSSVTNASNNTVIGRNIQSWTSSLSNNILIGDGSGNIRIMSDSTGNIGIGLTGPSYPLHVTGTVSSDGYNIGATAGFTGTGTYTNFTIIGGIIVSAS